MYLYLFCFLNNLQVKLTEMSRNVMCFNDVINLPTSKAEKRENKSFLQDTTTPKKKLKLSDPDVECVSSSQEMPSEIGYD